ncbi:T9SS type A sorting domain-containing protein [bacterium]
MMIRRLIFFDAILALLIIVPLICQIDPAIDARLERRSHTFQEMTLPYRLYIPDDFQQSADYPLLLFLHGARWSGSDNITQLDNEFAEYWIQDSVQNSNPSFVVYPQCPSGNSWESVSGVVSTFPPDPEQETINDLLDSLIYEFSIDENRLYIAGKSMGGHGVYGLLSRYPQRFTAAVIVAGNYVYREISEISHIPLWLLHARYDNVISVEQSRHMVQQLENDGHSFVFTHCKLNDTRCAPLCRASMDPIIEQGTRYFYSEFDTSGHQVEPKVVRTYGLHQWVFTQMTGSMGIELKSYPESALLFMNYPNPFNQHSVISYQLSAGGRIQVKVFDIRGRKVASLLDERQEAGGHRIRFDGGNLHSGIYVAELKTGKVVQRIKIILVK